MLRILITGKPSHPRAVAKVAGSKIAYAFTLTEKRWVGGQNVFVNWTVCVPEHKQLWAAGKVEKGFAVAVEASDIHFQIHPETDPPSVEPMVMLTEISDVF